MDARNTSPTNRTILWSLAAKAWAFRGRVLAAAMQELLRDPRLAREWGEAARRTALERFGIERFVRDWCTVLAEVTGTGRAALAA